MRLSGPALLALTLVACAEVTLPDAGPDAAEERDASREDSGELDAGLVLPTCDPMAALRRERMMFPSRGSGAYSLPLGDAAGAFSRLIVASLDGDAEAVEAEAAASGYQVCAGEGVQDGLILLEPIVLDEGRARVVVRPMGAPLILEAPHPLFDTNTLEQSIDLFEALEARALIVSGTHRCAGTTSSGCDGTTSACGAPAPYLDSDAAHNLASMFSAAHVTLSGTFAEDVVASLHGFGQDGASISDGTTDDVDASAPSARLAAALAARFADVTSCNAGAGVPVEVRLCGTTNTQGRHLNGSPNACLEPGTTTRGRFIHLEQSRAVRADRAGVIAAFRDALL